MKRTRSMRSWLVAVVLLATFSVGIPAIAQDGFGERSKGYVVILKNKQKI